MTNSKKSVVVLFSICLVVSLLLALINFVTAPVIEKTQKEAETKSLYAVLPDAKGFDKIELNENVPSTVTGIYKDTANNGYAVVLATQSQYSNGDMLISVGIDNSFKILDISLTSYNESKDFGKDTFPKSFIGKDKNLDGVDIVAGVTYSSKAFIGAIEDAFKGLEAVGEKAEVQ